MNKTKGKDPAQSDILVLPAHVASIADVCARAKDGGGPFDSVVVERLPQSPRQVRLLATDRRNAVVAIVPVFDPREVGTKPGMADSSVGTDRALLDAATWKRAFKRGRTWVAIRLLAEGARVWTEGGDGPLVAPARVERGEFDRVERRIPRTPPRGSIIVPIPMLRKLLAIMEPFAGKESHRVHIALQGPNAPLVLWAQSPVMGPWSG